MTTLEEDVLHLLNSDKNVQASARTKWYIRAGVTQLQLNRSEEAGPKGMLHNIIIIPSS